MENMSIYNAGRSVPAEAQKKFDNGRFKGTDINPMWRIKKLTELFGPCGIGWYYEVISERCEEHGDTDTIAIVDLNLYIRVDGEWSKPIYGTGGNVIKRFINKTQRIDVSDEGYKMALTDALSVACKALGIGADVYFEADRTKYTAARETQETKPVAKPEAPAVNLAGEPVYHCEDCGIQIGPVIGKSGRLVSVREQLELAGPLGKKALCASCITKRVKAQKTEQEGA